MQLKGQLREGLLLKRYKRFFADVLVDSQVVVAHVPNTGSLKTCLFPEAPCLISLSDNPARKLKATLHLVRTPTGWVGVDTSLPNALVFEAWQQGLIPDWQRFAAAKPEYKLSKETRLDLVLGADAEGLAAGRDLHHIEIKNVTLGDAGTARFPDAVTERGQKHLRELIALAGRGLGAEMVFVVQRQDCTAFAPADDIDPVYGRLLREARAKGVKIRALAFDYSPPAEIKLTAKELPLDF